MIMSLFHHLHFKLLQGVTNNINDSSVPFSLGVPNIHTREPAALSKNATVCVFVHFRQYYDVFIYVLDYTVHVYCKNIGEHVVILYYAVFI